MIVHKYQGLGDDGDFISNPTAATSCNVSSFATTTCLSGRRMWPMMHHKTTATKYNVYLAT